MIHNRLHFKTRYIHQLYSLKSSDYSLPKAYGLLYKENIPFRIIVSSINSTLHSFPNYLHKILHKSLPLLIIMLKIVFNYNIQYNTLQYTIYNKERKFQKIIF